MLTDAFKNKNMFAHTTTPHEDCFDCKKLISGFDKVYLMSYLSNWCWQKQM